MTDKQERIETMRFRFEMVVTIATVLAVLASAYQTFLMRQQFVASEQHAVEQQQASMEEQSKATEQRKSEGRPVLIVTSGFLIQENVDDTEPAGVITGKEVDVPIEIMNIGNGVAIFPMATWCFDEDRDAGYSVGPPKTYLLKNETSKISWAPFRQLAVDSKKVSREKFGTQKRVAGTLVLNCSTVDNELVVCCQRFAASVENNSAPKVLLTFNGSRFFKVYANSISYSKDFDNLMEEAKKLEAEWVAPPN